MRRRELTQQFLVPPKIAARLYLHNAQVHHGVVSDFAAKAWAIAGVTGKWNGEGARELAAAAWCRKVSKSSVERSTNDSDGASAGTLAALFRSPLMGVSAVVVMREGESAPSGLACGVEGATNRFEDVLDVVSELGGGIKDATIWFEELLGVVCAVEGATIGSKEVPDVVSELGGGIRGVTI